MFCIQLFGDTIDRLSRYGFDIIICKVILKVGKSGLDNMNMKGYGMTLKVIFRVIKIQFGPL